jgi:integrase
VARKIARLTALAVRRAKERGLYADGGGLYLQIDRDGNRSWIFRYGPQGRRNHGLGALHSVTLAEAREKARNCRKLLLEGLDPIAEKRARKAAARLEAAKSITFVTAAERYINDHHAAWKNEKNRTQWRNTLRDYAYPIIGKLPVAAIDTALVLQILQPIWTTKTETAARVRMRIERILSWATAQGFRGDDVPNPARWPQHLDNLLPQQTKVAPVRHHAALPYADVPAFITEMHERDGVAAEALEFLILTATRTSEVIGAEHREFDLKAKVWTIPARRMKGAVEFRVPLSQRAIAILKQQPRDGERVFPLSNMAFLQLLKRMDRDVTAHGFRSSFRDWCAETHDAARDVAEMSLAHAISDKTEAAYRRGDLFEKRRELMDDWAAFCAGKRRGVRRG